MVMGFLGVRKFTFDRQAFEIQYLKGINPPYDGEFLESKV